LIFYLGFGFALVAQSLLTVLLGLPLECGGLFTLSFEGPPLLRSKQLRQDVILRKTF